MDSTSASIAVIGAGPAGLTLAAVLTRAGVPVTVYERDAGRDARAQGGSLDMHADSGQVALAAAGLLEDFFRRARSEDQAMRLVDGRDGTVLIDHRPLDDERFNLEIDRGELRDLLLDPLPEGTVVWGAHLDAVTPVGNEARHRLTFSDGTVVEHDLVVGADGAWSRVRALLSPDVHPEYSGVTFVDVTIDDVDRAHPAIAALVGRGTTMMLAENRGLIAQRNGHGVLRVYVAFRRGLDWVDAAGLADATPDELRARLLELFADWPEEERAVIVAGEHPVLRPITALPVGHRWDHHPGATLLGDAAHLMSPFSGQGANHAMLDAADLARALVTHLAGDGPAAAAVDAAVVEYETTMFPRAREAAGFAAQGIDGAISADAPAHSYAMMKRFLA